MLHITPEQTQDDVTDDHKRVYHTAQNNSEHYFTKETNKVTETEEGEHEETKGPGLAQRLTNKIKGMFNL